MPGNASHDIGNVLFFVGVRAGDRRRYESLRTRRSTVSAGLLAALAQSARPDSTRKISFAKPKFFQGLIFCRYAILSKVRKAPLT